MTPPYKLLASMKKPNVCFAEGSRVGKYLLFASKFCLQTPKKLLREPSFRPFPNVLDWLKVQFQRYRLCERLHQTNCMPYRSVHSPDRSDIADFAKLLKGGR